MYVLLSWCFYAGIRKVQFNNIHEKVTQLNVMPQSCYSSAVVALEEDEIVAKQCPRLYYMYR